MIATKNGCTLREYQRSILQYEYEDMEDSKPPFIHVDETLLDIFKKSEIEIPAWEPANNIVPFEKRTYVCLDIETTGLGNSNSKNYINSEFNPMGDTIKMIGMKTEQGKIILKGNDEKAILKEFVYLFCKKQPYFLYTYNGYNFDMPFLIYKLDQYKIQHPFEIAKNPSKMSAAQMFGKPAVFHQIHCKWGKGKRTHIIDLYLGVLAWDYVARKLTKWSLKTVPVDLGLREEDERIELSYQQMLDCYENEDWETLEQYLNDDLDDTERVADFIMPAYYYQSLVIPYFNSQQLFIYGNATKLNKFLTTAYGEVNLPETEEPAKFKGGRTEAFCGFFPNTVKVDVASLYPTIMLAYMITSKKDTHNILLGALNYLRDTRLYHKARAKDKTISAEERLKSNRLQSAYKVIINSMYGFLGAKGIEYNDYEAGALVTAYGRAILQFMMDFVEEQKATIVNMDTDAVAYSSPEGMDTIIFEGMQKALPEWVDVEYEWCADVFVPSILSRENFDKPYKFDSYHGRNILRKYFEGISDVEITLITSMYGDSRVSFDMFLKISKMLNREFLTSEGLRKNYIVFVKGSDKVKAFGKYKKRDRSHLQKNFQIEYLRLFRTDREKAENYYFEIREQIARNSYPLEKLAVTKKIRKGAKKEIRWGLGQEGDVITFYKTDETLEGFKEEGLALIGSGKPYNSQFYLEEIEGLYNEIHDTLTIQEITQKTLEEVKKEKSNV